MKCYIDRHILYLQYICMDFVCVVFIENSGFFVFSFIQKWRVAYLETYWKIRVELSYTI